MVARLLFRAWLLWLGERGFFQEGFRGWKMCGSWLVRFGFEWAVANWRYVAVAGLLDHNHAAKGSRPKARGNGKMK